MLKIIKHNVNPSYEHQGVRYLKLVRWQNEILQDLASFDAFILQSKDDTENEAIIMQVRSHTDPQVYLTPIFSQTKIANNLIPHIDGVYNTDSSQIAKNILNKTQCIPRMSFKTFEEEIVHKTLCYTYSRNGELKPLKKRDSLLGFDYAFIGLFYKDEPTDMIKILKKMESQGYLNGKLIHRVPLCRNCADSFLLFTETCPKCRSITIGSEDIIHHFPCAHVAPISEFKQENDDQLQCPKCHKGLRHIGIDYDKPSQMHSCQSCNHQFQEADMQAECHSCGTQNHIQELQETELFDYKISIKGLTAAEKGFQQPATTPQAKDVFNEILKQEKKRKTTKGRQSYSIIIGLEGKILNALNPEFLYNLWMELGALSRTYVESHLHTNISNQGIQLLLLDKKPVEFGQIMKKLENNINILLADNIGAQLKANLQIEKLA